MIQNDSSEPTIVAAGTAVLRSATATDAAVAARLLLDMDPQLAAQEWPRFARSGESLLSAAERRCAAEDTDFSFRNTVLAISGGVVVGLILTVPVLARDLAEVRVDENKLRHLQDSIHTLAVFVVPAFRRRGIGRLLMLEAEERALLSGFRTTTLFVRADKEPALLLYEGLGYSEYGRASIAIDGPKETVQFLALSKMLGQPTMTPVA